MKVVFPKISIFIPVKNAASTIAKCIDGIKKQTLFKQTEVIIIDSGSTDNTIEILENYKFIRLYKIPPEDFSHGGTRNYGVSLAKGEFVVMTVQDAYPATDDWLEIMIKHFEDKKVVAVVGQQVTPHDKNKNPHQWYRPVSKARIIETYFEQPNSYIKLSGQEQDRAIFYDDVNTMYRKSTLLKLPFEEVMFGEDMLWIKNATEKGFKTIYDANSSVFHYHFLSYKYNYKINFTVLYYKFKIFNYIPKIEVNFKEYLLIIYRNFRFKTKLKWIFHNFAILHSQQKAYKKFKKEIKKGEQNLEKYFSENFSNVVQGKQKK